LELGDLADFKAISFDVICLMCIDVYCLLLPLVSLAMNRQRRKQSS